MNNNISDKDGIIEKLMARVVARGDADSKESWTAELLAGKDEKIIKKLGEEAMELVIAAGQKNQTEIIKESADVLYHMMVLWHKFGITPTMVGDELQKRESQSGLAEKMARPNKK